MPEPTLINSQEVPAPIGPYSHGALVGGLLFCTGQLPLGEHGTLVDGGPAEQARQCLENLAAVCETAGTSLARAVRVGVYVTDISAFAEVNEVYGAALPHHPARTTVEVSALPMGASVEMDAIVAMP
jgi:2-iminobutanoate/2-iminopropanoate deaminase